jgi:nucleoside-diphosphate-sugar epimerase
VKILLTGASGNVGSRVLPEVVRRSHSVRTFATLTDHRKPALMARVEAVWGDTTDPAAVARAVECERMIRESGLTWAIFRLVDVPILDVRDPHPIMFEIGLDNRIEALHAEDAGLAIANALETPEAWGRVLFIGGGPSCQVTYREYLTRLLAAMGVQPLPEEAFSDAVYATDWVDTAESEMLLHYQQHTFDDIAKVIAASLGWKRRIVSMASPLVRAAILRLSPYYRGH